MPQRRFDSEDGMRYWTECREFFRQFREQYNTTGSVLPSSRGLARALIRPMRRRDGPRRVLEVGPGTGAVTQEIVRQLRPGDRLDIVEINASFVDLLRRRFDQEPAFRRCRDQSRLLHAPIQAVEGQGIYDFVISGIPLNNFVPPLVEEIFASYRRLLRPEGTLSYFEYVAIRDVKRTLIAAERERLTALSALLEENIRRFQVAEEVVVFNVPPAVARHMVFGNEGSRSWAGIAGAPDYSSSGSALSRGR
jgi:phosphatidylethanolamine/phosphatidyl-N-methylethanolamine N-methyltransferase